MYFCQPAKPTVFKRRFLKILKIKNYFSKKKMKEEKKTV